MNFLTYKTASLILRSYPLLLTTNKLPVLLSYERINNHIHDHFLDPLFNHSDRYVFVSENDEGIKKNYNDVASIICDRGMYGNVIVMNKQRYWKWDISELDNISYQHSTY